MAPRPSHRRLALILVSVVAVIALLGLSLRHVGPGQVGVREASFGGGDPTVLQPGWHVAPRGVYRVHTYPSGSFTRPFGRPERVAFVSPEGSTMLASGEVAMSLDPQDALALHRAAGGRLEPWLESRIEDLIYRLLMSPDFVPLTRGHLPGMEEAGLALLQEILSGSGLRATRLRLESVGYKGGPLVAAGRRTDVERKVLWIAVDSFDWDIIDPLIEAGRMPNVARLREEGAWGRLQTVPPLLSPVLWTTIATGKRPDKHGILDFVATDPSSGAVIPVTSTLRKTSAFWNILSDSGISVGVVAWWASFPAEPVNGFMATDRIAYQLFKEAITDLPEDNPLKAHPRDLWDGIASRIVSPAAIGPDRLSRFIDLERHGDRLTPDDRERLNDFRTVLAATETYTGIATDLFRRRPTDVRVIYFEAPDTTSHLFMPFMPPAREGVSRELVDRFGNMVPEIYAAQDEWIGRLVGEFADAETTIIICSDHGFRTGDERPETESRIGKGKAADWHARDGVILLHGKDIRPGVRILGATLLDVVPTLLALYGLPVGRDMDGKVLTAAIDEGFLAAHPAGSVESYDTGTGRRGPEFAGITRGDQDLLDKLASLGYIEQDAPTARINEGTVFLQAGEYGKAVESLEAALEHGDRDEVRANLARAYRLDGRHEEALRELAVLEEKGWNPPEVLAEKAAVLRAQEDWPGAERLLDRAVEADPGLAGTRMHLARLYEQQERWEEALAAYRKAVELDRARGEALNQIGVISQKLGRTAQAMDAFTRAIEANPDLAGPYNNLGLIYRETGRADKARQVLETGITMAPRSPILHNSLGSLYYDAGEVDRAAASFRKALEHDPDYTEAISNLAVISQDLGDPVATGEYLARLVELEPGNSDARVSLALTLIARNRVEEAEGILRELLEARPGNFKALVTLGKLHMRRGEYAEAVRLLERAGGVDAGIPQLWNDLSLAYAKLGRSDRAREALRRSIALDPEQEEVARQLAAMGG